MGNNPEWYYYEKQSGVDYSDPEIVREYDNQHQFRNFKEETEGIVHRLNIEPGDTVLEFGCGTGGITLNLAKYCQKVIGVDVSKEMLGILNEKAGKQNIVNIETHHAGFLTYDHDPFCEVDKIVSVFALHHLPDFWKSVAILKMAEILKPGKKLYLFDVVFTFKVKDHQKILEEMIEDMRDLAGDSMARETITHIRDEFSTYDWIMEGLLVKSGFSIDSVEVGGKNLIGYVCSKL
jgi:ubiquinone/menaquinone biosynthesis C-methylase UbiE